MNKHKPRDLEARERICNVLKPICTAPSSLYLTEGHLLDAEPLASLRALHTAHGESEEGAPPPTAVQNLVTGEASTRRGRVVSFLGKVQDSKSIS